MRLGLVLDSILTVTTNSGAVIEIMTVCGRHRSRRCIITTVTKRKRRWNRASNSYDCEKRMVICGVWRERRKVIHLLQEFIYQKNTYKNNAYKKIIILQ